MDGFEKHLEAIERETGSRIDNVRFITADSRKPDAFHRRLPVVTLQNGKKYTAKLLEMSGDRAEELSRICEMKLPGLQRIPYMIRTGRTEYLVMAEWVPGSVLEDKIYAELPYSRIIHEAAAELRKVHDGTLTAINCRVTEEDVRMTIGAASLDRETEETLTAYALGVLPLINSRCVSVTHGDMHAGNMVCGSDGRVTFIDLDDASYADPYRDLVYASNIIIDRRLYPFYYGFIRDYFGGDPPEEFWKVVNFYSIAKIITIMGCEKRLNGGRAMISPESFIRSHDGLFADEAAWYRNIREGSGLMI